MQHHLEPFLLLCAIGFAASQTFSSSLGLNDASSLNINEKPFNFQKLNTPSESTSELNNNARSIARGAFRMASGSSRGRTQVIPQSVTTTHAFTSTAPATRISTRNLFTPKTTTPSPVATRKSPSSSARKSDSTTDGKKQKVNNQLISSFSFSGITDEKDIEQVTQSIKRNIARIPQTTVTNTERAPQSSFIEKSNTSVNRNVERIPQRVQSNIERMPQSTVTNSKRVPLTLSMKTNRVPQIANNITKSALQSGIQKIELTSQSAVRNVDRVRHTTASNQPESSKVNEIEIGRSPCARGIQGHDCRMQLLLTALACTSGQCHQCQQCGSISPEQWVSCCRDHFQCCRSLARSCQRCDHPTLTPFCKVAFGKCK